MTRAVGLVIVAGLACLPAGCASAHYVHKQSDGGVVAIPTNNNDWPFHYRDEAEALIRKHVGSNYEIVDEREVVTGSRVINNEQTDRTKTANKRNPNLPGERETTTETITSSNVTRWEITYRRRDGAPMQTAGPVGPGAPPAVMPAAGVAPTQPGPVVPAVGPR